MSTGLQQVKACGPSLTYLLISNVNGLLQDAVLIDAGVRALDVNGVGWSVRRQYWRTVSMWNSRHSVWYGSPWLPLWESPPLSPKTAIWSERTVAGSTTGLR